MDPQRTDLGWGPDPECHDAEGDSLDGELKEDTVAYTCKRDLF